MGKIIDLSIPVEEWMPHFPGDPVPQVKKVLTLAKDGCRVRKLLLGTHTGTHVDAPAHLIREGHTIEELPLEQFMGTGIVINLLNLQPNHKITVDDIAGYEAQARQAEVVLLNTGWTKKYGHSEFFQHPYLSKEAAELIASWNIKAIGVDMLDIDKTESAKRETMKKQPMPAHEILLAHEIVIIENLTNIEEIDFERPHICYMPLNITGGDGSPVRAFAMELPA